MNGKINRIFYSNWNLCKGYKWKGIDKICPEKNSATLPLRLIMLWDFV